MSFNPENHHRRSVRLKNYDYSQPGSYFITICTNDRKKLFGDIETTSIDRAGLEPAPTENSHVKLNNYGEIVLQTWQDLVKHNNGIKLGEFVIMPNHIHGIIHIIDSETEWDDFTPSNFKFRDVGAGSKPALNHYEKRTSLSEVIRQFKTFSTRKINRLWKTPGVSIWQRDYFEHIIRDQKSYDQIVEYIQNNPLMWKKDKLFVD